MQVQKGLDLLIDMDTKLFQIYFKTFVVLSMVLCSSANAFELRHIPQYNSKVYKINHPDPYTKYINEAETNATLDKLESVGDYENYAKMVLSEAAKKYILEGALNGNTKRENEAAFHRYRFRPRMMKNVGEREMSTYLQGSKVSLPLGLSPTALQRLASENGEIDTALAACKVKTLMIVSVMSSVQLEDIAEAAPGCPKWQDVYFFTNRSITADMVRRAEASGYNAIVATVDSPYYGRSLEKDFLALPENLNQENVVRYLPPGQKELEPQVVPDPTATWETVTWLKTITTLPIIVKGILTGADAKIAMEHGVQGVFVSNQGGRQLDNDPATIEVLPEVVRALRGSKIEIYMDGGIRNGSDILTALALGAKAAFIGRPNLFGLAAGGEEGSRRVMERLRSELDLAMALLGVRSVREIPDDLVVRQKYYNMSAPPADRPIITKII